MRPLPIVGTLNRLQRKPASSTHVGRNHPLITTTVPDNSTSRLTSNRHCVFCCGDSWFSLPAVVIREVTASPQPVSLPESPAWLEGLVHLHSEFIPVISLSKFLDIDSMSQADDAGRLLVINSNPPWALRVSSVAALADVDAKLNPGNHLVANQPTCIVGTFTWGSEIARVLEPRHTLSQIQKALHQTWTQSESGASADSIPPQ